MVYEKCAICAGKKIKLRNRWNFVENETKIMQRVFKTRYFSLLSKYV